MNRNNLGNKAYLDNTSGDDGLYPIWGIAIGNNDVTVGSKSGEPKLWRPSVLEEAADTLEGKDIVVNHENQDAYELIGKITEAKYDDNRGVIYRGEIDNDELADKIERGWLEVSPRIIHSKSHEMINDVKVPDSIQKFDNLSVVRRGAARSNEVNLGEPEELSVAELQDSFDEPEEGVAEYQSVADDYEFEELQDGVNYARWMFNSPEAAQGAAQKFDCNDYHEHTIEGTKYYMPCPDHDTFLQNLNKSMNDELSEGDMVSWGDGKGRIVELAENGAYDGTISNRRVEGDEDDPAALIEVYEENDEELEPTEESVGYNVSELKKVEENVEVEELQLSETRTPDYDGTEEKSWGDIPAGQLEYWTEALGYEAEQTDDLTQEQKEEIASHTLLGDPEADNIRSLRFFPVVNAETGNLNRGALEAVRSGRGQSADIPDDAYESAYEEAGRLLNEEFDSDVEEEMGDAMKSDEYSREEKMAASHMSSITEMRKVECLELIRGMRPGPAPPGVIANVLSKLTDIEQSKLEKVVDIVSDAEMNKVSREQLSEMGIELEEESDGDSSEEKQFGALEEIFK